jgi:hypothetical protein
MIFLACPAGVPGAVFQGVIPAPPYPKRGAGYEEPLPNFHRDDGWTSRLVIKYRKLKWHKGVYARPPSLVNGLIE